jgi:hypothetical protein
MIYNRSGHPVEIKKISVRVWKLRDEIEAAIERRMRECEAAAVPLFIEDIKRFYNLDMASPLTEQDNVLQLRPTQDEGVNDLMESIAQDSGIPEEAAVIPEVEGETGKTFVEAEKIMEEQNLQGLETKKPNPILERPYQRQAPDMDKISYGFTLLSDLNMENSLCFMKDKFLQGQSVVVEFLIPKSFMVTGEVLYCHHYAMRSRIISSTKPDYRVQNKCTFAIPGEREALRNFLKSIEPTIVTEKKKPKKATAEDDILDL